MVTSQLFGEVIDGRRTARLNLASEIARVVRWIAVFAALASVVWWAGFLVIFTSTLRRITDLTGFDVPVARVISLALLVCPLVMPVWMITLPWLGRNRWRITWLVVLVAVSMPMLDRFTHDVYFARSDGRALRYYIRTIDGFKFSLSTGADPEFGVSFQPVTPEVFLEYLAWKRHGELTKVSTEPCPNLFSPDTGQPQCWILELPSGGFEFSPVPGYHPIYGLKMEPVTPKLAREIEEYKEQVANRAQKESQERMQRQAEEDRKQQAIATLETSPEFKRLHVVIAAIESVQEPVVTSDHGSDLPFGQRTNKALKQGTILVGELRLARRKSAPEDWPRVENEIDVLNYAVEKATGIRPGARIMVVFPNDVRAGATTIIKAGSLVEGVFTAQVVGKDGSEIRTSLETLWLRSPRGVNQKFLAHLLTDGTILQDGAVIRLVLDDYFGDS